MLGKATFPAENSKKTIWEVGFLYLNLLHLPLPDLVIAVRDEVAPHLSQGQRQPSIRLSRGRKCRNLNIYNKTL